MSELANGQGALCYVSGETSLEALYHEKNTLPARFPNLRNWYFVVVDLVDVTHLRGDFTDVEALVEQDRRVFSEFREGTALAIIAQGAAFGIARMWEGLSSAKWESKVFRDRASAETWVRQQVLATFGVELHPIKLDSAGDTSGESATG